MTALDGVFGNVAMDDNYSLDYSILFNKVHLYQNMDYAKYYDATTPGIESYQKIDEVTDDTPTVEEKVNVVNEDNIPTSRIQNAEGAGRMIIPKRGGAKKIYKTHTANTVIKKGGRYMKYKPGKIAKAIPKSIAKAVKKVIKKSGGKYEPGIPMHKHDTLHYPGPKHQETHDPAHNLRRSLLR